MDPRISAAAARAIEARLPEAAYESETATRLLNGFTEGCPSLSIDRYGATLVVHDQHGDEASVRAAVGWVVELIPWIRAAVWKSRRAESAEGRRGRLVLGTPADVATHIVENGVRYAVDLTLNHDASFYLDTRGARAWAKRRLAGARVLNTFAYTGSLGVAAAAAPAREVIHVDRSRRFLDVARASTALNGIAVHKGDFRARDFFVETAGLRREGALFDAVFVDPPFFAEGPTGRVDLEAEADRVLNKVRPLVGDGGRLVAVNNALWLSGARYLAILETLCADGWLEIEETIPVPGDVVGLVRVPGPTWPADPSPFNHPTKIVVLRAKRKDGRKA